MPRTIGNYSRAKLDEIVSSVSVSASPGGSDSQLQYNNGGSETGGVSTLTFNDSTGHLTVADDKKLYFGDGSDAYIVYDESSSDYLTISGSTEGIALSGSKIQIDGTLVGASPLKIAGGIEIVTVSGEDTTSMQFGDDIKTQWGDDNDSFIQWKATGAATGYFILSGSTNGIVLSGSAVEVDGKLGIGVAGASITHAITLPDTANAAGRVKANAYLTYSSIRYKENVRTIKDPMAILSDIRGITFSWKENKKSDFGFIAEEVGKKIPSIVEWDKNHKSAYSMDYTRIIPILVEGIKEQQDQIDALKSEIILLKELTETRS